MTAWLAARGTVEATSKSPVEQHENLVVASKIWHDYLLYWHYAATHRR